MYFESFAPWKTCFTQPLKSRPFSSFFPWPSPLARLWRKAMGAPATRNKANAAQDCAHARAKRRKALALSLLHSGWNGLLYAWEKFLLWSTVVKYQWKNFQPNHNWQKSLQMFRGHLKKKFKLVLEQFLNYCQKNMHKGILCQIYGQVYSLVFFMEDFQNFWTKMSPKLAQFIWEAPYSVPYATGLDNGGKLYV